MRHHQRIALICTAILTLLVPTMFLVPSAQAVPLDHARIGHSKKSERAVVGVCKDWSGTKKDPGCKKGTKRVSLSKGERTKAGEDWDGFVKPAGYWAEIQVGVVIYTSNSSKAEKEVKLSGCKGCTKWIILHKW